MVLAPYTTVMRVLKGASKIDFFSPPRHRPMRSTRRRRQIEALLRQRHRIRAGQDSDFLIRSQKEISQTADQASSTLSFLLGTIASISLLVGGIGIVNIMLVSVTQRTHEIGLRLAIGARRRDILAQFLIEALALSLGGGLTGVAIGIAATRVLAWKARWPVVLSPVGVGDRLRAVGGVGTGRRLLSGLEGVPPQARSTPCAPDHLRLYGMDDPVDRLRQRGHAKLTMVLTSSSDRMPSASSTPPSEISTKTCSRRGDSCSMLLAAVLPRSREIGPRRTPP